MSKDSVLLGLGTNSTGTLTITNNGTANFLCGLEMGVNGYGTLNVGGNGTLVDNGWFTVGRGQQNSGIASSGTFNMSGGTVYILPNAAGGTGPSAANGGLCIDQFSTNSTVNISGGTLYACRINFDSYTNVIGGAIITNTDTLNISGGLIYVGNGGVNSNLTVSGTNCSSFQSVNISGGTFHTADMLQSNTNGIAGTWGAFGAITNVTGLTDGTNWAWTASLPVNLTNSSFTVNGVTGPGYVTFAPEANRTITLNNVWSGPGGMWFAGPGQVITAGPITNSWVNISGGELTVENHFSVPLIIIGGGATYNLSLVGPVTLASPLVVSNSSSPAIIDGTVNSGTATANLTYANNGTPSWTIIGTLTLSANTVLTINNTGPTLIHGNYLIISTNTGSSVVNGTVPTSLTLSGSLTPAAATSSSLSINNSQLYLVVPDSAPTIANIVTKTVPYGSTWSIAINDLKAAAGWTDPDSDTVTFSSVVGSASANGTNMTSDINNIYYNGAVTAPDSFSYIVTDGTLTTTGTVYLVAAPAFSPIISLPAVNGIGNPTFSGTGASTNCIYGVESTTSLTGTPVWIEAGTTTTDVNGDWSFTDVGQTNPQTIFYRLYIPDDSSSPPQ
jgi:hypothetical protein